MIDEIEQIRQTVNTYLDAVKYKEWNKFLESWHPDAKMSFIRDGEVHSVPRSFWKDWCNQPANPKETRTSTVASIDMTGDIAIAKAISFQQSPDDKVLLTDYLTLLRQSNDKWIIISKSFTSEKL